MKLPDAVLGKHIAILGKTGSGKTYTAKGSVEDLFDQKQRVCVIDPTGAWWGLRLMADGKTPAYPVVVFGGRRADVEIKASQGAAIGELIASGAVPASIIDTQLFSVAEYTRFITDFAEAMFRSLKGTLNLVIDEAHKFAPKGKVPSPQAGQMLHAINNLVSGGRSIGFRIMLLTQRPAKLHNDSLTQVDTLIAMRLMAPHDKAAVKDWISDNTEGEQLGEVMGSLASLQPGEGWVWCPDLGPATRTRFPRIKTFDSSATPTTSGKPLATLAPVDLSVVRARLAEIEGNATVPPVTPSKAGKKLEKAYAATDPAVLKAEYERGRGDADALTEAVKEEYFAKGRAAVAADLQPVLNQIAKNVTDAAAYVSRILEGALAGGSGHGPLPIIKARPASPAVERSLIPAPQRAARAARPASSPSGRPPAQQKILDALAWGQAIKLAALPKVQLAYLADASPKSSSLTNNLSALRTAGLIDYAPGARVLLTKAGLEVANRPKTKPTTADVQAAVRSKVAPGQWRLVEALIAVYPKDLSKAELARAAQASASSSSLTNNLSFLRGLGVIDYPSPGRVVATGILFLKGK